MNVNKLLTKFNALVFFDSCGTLNGYTEKILDGYVIFVNENLNQEKVTETVQHELWHIILGHLDDNKEMSEHDKEFEVFLNMHK